MDKVTSDLMICYYRLSSEDGDVVRGNAAESFSISAQRLCVQNFLASRPDLEGTVEEIVDDGYTGTNMNRPGMQRLLSLVKSGSVKTVIVRDLSRFSRNFLEGGHYLEFVFPAYGVRFISINDHFDSADYGESTGGLELGITNLLNQLYSRDLSRKIKSVTDRKKLNGEYAFGAVPYGYQKGEQKNTIVVDPPAADVVRQIFQWASQGISITQIAQRLNASGTETPSVYLAKARGRYKVRKFWTYEPSGIFSKTASTPAIRRRSNPMWSRSAATARSCSPKRSAPSSPIRTSLSFHGSYIFSPAAPCKKRHRKRRQETRQACCNPISSAAAAETIW